MKRKLLVLILSIPLLMGAQVRKYSNEYLHIGVGGRGMAMSSSLAASTNDIYSLYYNPAGLAHINKEVQLSFMHSEYLCMQKFALP